MKYEESGSESNALLLFISKKVIVSRGQTAISIAIPYSASFRVIVEHSILMVPNDVLRCLTNNLFNNTFELYRATSFVILFIHRFVSLVNYFNLRNCKEKGGYTNNSIAKCCIICVATGKSISQ